MPKQLASNLAATQPEPERDTIFELLTGLTKGGLYERARSGEEYPELIMTDPSVRSTIDLPAHAIASEAITDRLGYIPALFAGGFQEAMGGMDALRAGEPLFSESAISPADLLANLVGIREGSPVASFLMDLVGGEGTEQQLQDAIEILVQLGL